MPLPQPPLLIISDRSQARLPLTAVAEAAFAAGCRWFSLREKDLPPDRRRTLLRSLLAVGRRYGATVTAHQDIEGVLATGGDGVHLPSGADPGEARMRLPDRLLGGSAHSAEEAERLLRAGADYATLSPIFLTRSKPGYGPAVGLEGLARAAVSVPGPIVALGGIDATNAADCLAAGAAGIAVMGEIMRAADPGRATAALLKALRSGAPAHKG